MASLQMSDEPYFYIIVSKNWQKPSAIQNNSVALSSVSIAIIVVCNTLCLNTIKSYSHFC